MFNTHKNLNPWYSEGKIEEELKFAFVNAAKKFSAKKFVQNVIINVAIRAVLVLTAIIINVTVGKNAILFAVVNDNHKG